MSDGDVSCIAPVRRRASFQSLSNAPRWSSFVESATKPLRLTPFVKVQNPLRLPREKTLQRANLLWFYLFGFEALPAQAGCTFWMAHFTKCPRCFFSFTSKRASRHSRAHFFNSSTSKIAPGLRRFWHFDLKTCFAPQLRDFSETLFPRLLEA